MALDNIKILLIISGGIAIQKTPALIELLHNDGASVTSIMTQNARNFISLEDIATQTGNKVHTDTFDKDGWMEHIDLSRNADLILVAPATANILAKMAHGLADDLASTTLLASNKSVMVCPAMNVEMWNNAATQRNIEILHQDNVTIVGPAPGLLACGEFGMGRLSEPADIFAAVQNHFKPKRLAGRSALVTSGPTHEPIDPVRYIANRSSGKQGHAIARALADLGASVTLVTGPTPLPDPRGVTTIHIESAKEMMAACQSALPADIAVCAAAVGDWTPTYQSSKIKKSGDADIALTLSQNPDILARLSTKGPQRPALVVGFAAETDDVLPNAQAKLAKKGCDWLVANSVSMANPAFGVDENQVYFITQADTQKWPRMGKDDIAKKLCNHIADHFSKDALKTAAE